VSYFTLRTFIILMETINDLYYKCPGIPLAWHTRAGFSLANQPA